MKKLQFIPLVLLLFAAITDVRSQSATNKIRMQPIDATYNKEMQKRDNRISFDSKNKTVDIIDNLENPKGTVVIDGELSIEQAKRSLQNYKQTVFNDNNAVLSYERNNCIYKVDVVNNRSHHKLTDPEVQTHLSSLLAETWAMTGELPKSIQLRHYPRIDRCAFFCYPSASQIYNNYFHISRLNMACVFNLLRDNRNLVINAKTH